MPADTMLPFDQIQGQPLNDEQRAYLEGLFAGLHQRVKCWHL
jgi:hypothetical protein